MSIQDVDRSSDHTARHPSYVPRAAELRASRQRNAPGALPLLWSPPGVKPPVGQGVQRIAARLLKMAPRKAPAESIQQPHFLARRLPMEEEVTLETGADELEKILKPLMPSDQPQVDAEGLTLTIGLHNQDLQQLQAYMELLSLPTSRVCSEDPASAIGPNLSEVAQALIVLAPPGTQQQIVQSLHSLARNPITPDMSDEDARRILLAAFTTRMDDGEQADVPTFLAERLDETSPSASHTSNELAGSAVCIPGSKEQDAEMVVWRAEFVAHIKHLRQRSVVDHNTSPVRFPEVCRADLNTITFIPEIAEDLLGTASNDAQPLVLQVLRNAAAERPLGDSMSLEQALAGVRLLSRMFEENLRQNGPTSLDLAPGHCEETDSERKLQADRPTFCAEEPEGSEHAPSNTSPLEDEDREWMQHFIKHVAAIQPIDAFLAQTYTTSVDTTSVNELKYRLPLLDKLALALLELPRPYTPPGIQRLLEAVIWRPESRIDFLPAATVLRQLVVQLGIFEIALEWSSKTIMMREVFKQLDTLYACCMGRVEPGVSASSHHPDAFIPPEMAQALLDRPSRTPQPIKRMLHELMSGLPPGLDMNDDTVDLMLNRFLEYQALHFGSPVPEEEMTSEASATSRQIHALSVASIEALNDHERIAHPHSVFPGNEHGDEDNSEDEDEFDNEVSGVDQTSHDILHQIRQHEQAQPHIILVEDQSDWSSDIYSEDYVERVPYDPSLRSSVPHHVIRELEGCIAQVRADADLLEGLFENRQAVAQMGPGSSRLGVYNEYSPGDRNAMSDDDGEQGADSGLFRMTGMRMGESLNEAQSATAPERLDLEEDGDLFEYVTDDEIDAIRRVLSQD